MPIAVPPPLNLYVGWLAILVGLMVGAGIGLFFHSEEWLGGYSSWRRRMVRLGHISFLGTGLLNLAFGLTIERLDGYHSPSVAQMLMVLGAVTMPLVCFLAAWRKPYRQLFFIPVASLIGGAGDVVLRGFLR